jgi:hypothetical protein
MADFTSIDKATKMLNTSVDYPDANTNLTEEQLAAVDITSPLNLTLSIVKPVFPLITSLPALAVSLPSLVLPPMPFKLPSLPSVTALSSFTSSLTGSLSALLPVVPTLSLNLVKSLLSVAVKVPKMIDIPSLPQLPQTVFDVGVKIPQIALTTLLPDLPPNPLAALKQKVSGLFSGSATAPELANLKRDVQTEQQLSINVAGTSSTQTSSVSAPSVSTPRVPSVPTLPNTSGSLDISVA